MLACRNASITLLTQGIAGFIFVLAVGVSLMGLRPTLHFGGGLLIIYLGYIGYLFLYPVLEKLFAYYVLLLFFSKTKSSMEKLYPSYPNCLIILIIGLFLLYFYSFLLFLL
ncbi:MAG: hypothetical protein HFJ52_07765 [Clostridia bacterium]|nr:hypothetical protein [Clostridia bacterium]